MIHVVTAANRALYRDQLLQAHRQRTEVFREGYGWPLRVAPDGGEYDEGDDDRAVYFLALNAAGGVLAHVRARPTDDWSCTGSVFPQFVADPAGVNDAHTWEMARYYAVGPLRGGEGLRRRGELRLALLDEALKRGVRRIVTINELSLLGPALRSGWRVRPIGAPGDYGQGMGVAIEVEVSPASRHELMEKLGVDAVARLDLTPDGPLADLPVCRAEAVSRALSVTPADELELLAEALALAAAIDRAEGPGEGAALLEQVRRSVDDGRSLAESLARVLTARAAAPGPSA